jgi:hypothetical protein
MSTETTYEPFWWKEITKDWVAKWQLTGPWEAGGNQHHPAGTMLIAELNLSGRIIDNIVRTADGAVVPVPVPLESLCLNQAAANYMSEWYGMELAHRMRAVPGVVFTKIDPPTHQPTAEEIAKWKEFDARRRGRKG